MDGMVYMYSMGHGKRTSFEFHNFFVSSNLWSRFAGQFMVISSRAFTKLKANADHRQEKNINKNKQQQQKQKT